MDVPRHPTAEIAVGVFGGSGLYQLLDGATEVAVETPYGPPSAALTVGEVEAAGSALVRFVGPVVLALIMIVGLLG